MSITVLDPVPLTTWTVTVSSSCLWRTCLSTRTR